MDVHGIVNHYMQTDVYQQSLAFHRKYRGKLSVVPVIPIVSKDDLAVMYTPGVAEPCRVIAKDPQASFDLTMRGRSVAVVSNGTAVLGLGDIGPEAAMPVMEGKALLLKQFGGVDAIPLVIDARDPQEIIAFVKQIRPTFAGINLEDIAAPACFAVEDGLQDLGIPVFHDDQHGTAIVVTAALHNAALVVGKKYEDLNVVVVGAGSAGLSVARMLSGLNCFAGACDLHTALPSVGDVILVDSVGIVSKHRNDLHVYKQAVMGFTNKENRVGDLAVAMKGADVVIGVSRAGIITAEMVASMAERAIVFALANPAPEIMPDEATRAGAMVVATGRSDFPNQINNLLAFPAVFRAVIDARLTKITLPMKVAASKAIAALVPNPTAGEIVPSVFYPDLAKIVAEAIIAAKV